MKNIKLVHVRREEWERDFAAWGREMRQPEARLTAAPWVGWLEETDEQYPGD
ncbi:hypothetical protein AB0N65_10950 [Paenarthrobacter sp. NPDC089322]|uniref:hypothetical protein n=1 Tax=Paenarthrobacter sp. NPDC089322 TaxID=3155065 RepID=UPI00343373D8